MNGVTTIVAPLRTAWSWIASTTFGEGLSKMVTTMSTEVNAKVLTFLRDWVPEPIAKLFGLPPPANNGDSEKPMSGDDKMVGRLFQALLPPAGPEKSNVPLQTRLFEGLVDSFSKLHDIDFATFETALEMLVGTFRGQKLTKEEKKALLEKIKKKWNGPGTF